MILTSPKELLLMIQKVCFQHVQYFCHLHVNCSKLCAMHWDNLHMAIWID